MPVSKVWQVCQPFGTLHLREAKQSGHRFVHVLAKIAVLVIREMAEHRMMERRL